MNLSHAHLAFKFVSAIQQRSFILNVSAIIPTKLYFTVMTPGKTLYISAHNSWTLAIFRSTVLGMTQEVVGTFTRISVLPTLPLKGSPAAFTEDSGKSRPIPLSMCISSSRRTSEFTSEFLSELTWLVPNARNLNPIIALNQDACFPDMNQWQINSFPSCSADDWWLWTTSLHLLHTFDSMSTFSPWWGHPT